MKPAVRTFIGMACFALVTGCGGEKPAPPPRVAAQAPAVAEPPPDVTALKTWLRDTRAMGAFTRLALRNQAEDLLEQFRAHYRRDRKTPDDSLRQSYDMLVMKALCLVQDDDPTLARTILGSREAVWSVLADPGKIDSIGVPIN
jgi:hypothetical protein